jgi:hypothetical protein
MVAAAHYHPMIGTAVTAVGGRVSLEEQSLEVKIFFSNQITYPIMSFIHSIISYFSACIQTSPVSVVARS